MSAVRLRRLQNDFKSVEAFARLHPRVRLVQAQGDPPEVYQLAYQVKSVQQKGEGVVEHDQFLVEISLPREYPRVPPFCRMLTPIFHPNIAPHAVCVGDHWSAGESLAALIARIGEMIGYQSYNVKSPLNGDAAKWAQENAAKLPLDAVSMLIDPAALASAGPPTFVPNAAPVVTAAPRPDSGGSRPPLAGRNGFACPACGNVMRVLSAMAGKAGRCPRCSEVVRFPAGPS